MDEVARQTYADLTRERWEANADYWVKVIRGGHDRYRTELTDRALLEAVGPCAGLRVLDAGCGEGYLSRTLAERGASVVGVDAAQGLVDAAQAVPTAAEFVRAGVEALPMPDAEFDLVVCNHLFSHLADPGPAIAEFGRVLKGGGRLIVLTLHPCFYVERSEHGERASVPADRYFEARGIDQYFAVDGLDSPSMITSWLRPLEYYSRTLREAGFVITDLREPHPSAEQLRDDPWWRVGFPSPLFMLLVAELR
ncbi:class I SAM-dependent methyltransferase [Actinomadura parmotrematis]|uniref:Methyltransferase domain-containing protein n=1 Tax=Actinomadura parmotrematis TaxID=2864039 RepID=A0ABS7FQ93_9ACTN|nr:methyltransferase domain-containing protein [Actinomadura parmotrematis]MBW8481718.1 methyltransferase domain-containing protein [Actinomadura parmotrematis]